MEIDLGGGLYCEITLYWYNKDRYVGIPCQDTSRNNYKIWMVTPIQGNNELNGPNHALKSVLLFVASFVADAELGALFFNLKERKTISLILEDLMGHLQPSTPIHCNNSVRKYLLVLQMFIE